MSSKALLVALRAILSPKFWRKVVPCEKMADLHAHCSKEEVVLPDFVAQYEKELVSVMCLGLGLSVCQRPWLCLDLCLWLHLGLGLDLGGMQFAQRTHHLSGRNVQDNSILNQMPSLFSW